MIVPTLRDSKKKDMLADLKTRHYMDWRGTLSQYDGVRETG